MGQAGIRCGESCALCTRSVAAVGYRARMGSQPGRPSTARGREIGSELRRIRERVGLDGKELAEMLGWSPSKVSRLESGTRTTTEVDVAMYLAICRVGRAEIDSLLELARETDEGYFLRPHGQQLPDELRSLVIQETMASSITSFEPLVIPGLLQTEDYARELFRWAGLIPEDGIGVRVHARMARQSLLDGHRAPQCTFFVHEQALRSVVGSARLMHEQMLRLLFASSRPRCVVRVVPRSVGPCGAFAGSFRVMHYAEHPPVVYVQNETASLFLEGADDIATHRKILVRLGDVALDGAQSREWLARLASEYELTEDSRDEPPQDK